MARAEERARELLARSEAEWDEMTASVATTLASAMGAIQECFEQLTGSIQSVLQQRGARLQTTLGEVSELTEKLQAVKEKTARIRGGVEKLRGLSALSSSLLPATTAEQ